MQYKFFTISARSPDAEEDLNKFLRSNRILTVNLEFVPNSSEPQWCIAVEYLQGSNQAPKNSSRQKTDYKEILAPEEFALFAKLREWRKAKAEQEGIPVYTIFTNEQLAKIAVDRITSKSGLGQIDGVGEGRVSKYSSALFEIVNAHITHQDQTGDS